MAPLKVTVPLTILALVSLAFAGCVDEPTPQAEAGVTSVDEGDTDCTDCGSVRGLISSDLFEPIQGATITLVLPSGPRDVKSDSEGAFSFENVPAGRHDVFAFAGGYFDGRLAAVVEPNTVTELRFTLNPLPSDEPYVEYNETSGKITWAAAWQAEVPTQGCVVVPLGLWTVKNCGGLRDGRAVNGEIAINVTEDVETILIELVWQPAGELGKYLSLDAMCPEVPRGGSGAVLDTEHACYYQSEEPKSPIVLRIDADEWRDGQYNHTGFWAARVFSTYGMLGTHGATGIDVGAAYEQKFTIYTALYHKEPAPDGARAAPDA